ncbi:MAG: NUDIX hydrolase, partial [Leptolyngbya sp. SIO3F4]|nr:NUDIX hydrolase [Leptolyngbya sp. SIO3F4]
GPKRDPREAEDIYNVRYLSVSYFALVRFAEAELIADGVSGIAWYPLNQLPELAFDHQEILTYGTMRLRNKLKYSPVAFDVLPEMFTLSDLYQVYTTILGEDFSDYSNFRTRLLKLGFLKDTNIKTSRGAGRPASLYRFDAEAFEPLKDKPMVFV